MLETTIVAVLAFVVWFIAIQGGIGLPSTRRSEAPLTRRSEAPLRFSLRTLLIAITILALTLGLTIATTR